MTDLSEARKALGRLKDRLEDPCHELFDKNLADYSILLERHIPAILQCLQDAEQQPEAPSVRAW